jgi:hypothetical protein
MISRQIKTIWSACGGSTGSASSSGGFDLFLKKK